jgi:tRNA 2-selenouridine synthase
VKQLSCGDFESLFLGATRWIDVRAPVEFAVGAVPGAMNLPLLTDDERHRVGIAYKKEGQAKAIELGHRIVTGEVRDQRTHDWLLAAKSPSPTVIYCFRGGLRSQTVQAWLSESGLELPIIAGGYKALRNFFLDILKSRIPETEFEVVSGPTGSGKTTYLHESGRPFIDLEGLAVHRGSAFGGFETPQPSQADFENALALAILRLPADGGKILIESESRLIGRCSLPEVLTLKMKESPRIEIDLPITERVENIFRDYILESSLGRVGNLEKFEEFRRAVISISRKLGDLRAREILEDLNFSRTEFEAGRGLDTNRIWIEKLLLWYYDPSYRFSIYR